MAEYRRKFDCEVLAPDRLVHRAEAVGAIFPAVDGSIGVLGGRAPLIAQIGVGRFVLEQPDGGETELFVCRGFARMDADHLSILAEEACRLEDLDPEAAWDQLSEARARTAETDEQLRRREELVEQARVKFGLAQEYRRKLRGSIDRDHGDED